MAGETHHRAGPRTPGTVGRYGGKMYNGVIHWQRRLAWFTSTPNAVPPHQWQTADGERRCVRCGSREFSVEIAIERERWFGCVDCEKLILDEISC